MEWKVCPKYTHGGTIKGVVKANFRCKHLKYLESIYLFSINSNYLQRLGIHPSKYGPSTTPYPGSGGYERGQHEYLEYSGSGDRSAEYRDGLKERSTKPTRSQHETTKPTESEDRKPTGLYLYIEEEVTALQ